MGSIIDDGDGHGRRQIDIEFAGDLGAGRHGGRGCGDHDEQHRAGRSDRQERAGHCCTRLGRGRDLKPASGQFPAAAHLSGPDFSFGTTIPDPGCAARLDARTLWSMGLKKAAVARLCLNGDIYRAMPEVCIKYLPSPAPGYPAPPPVPTPTRFVEVEASDEQPYTGGDIWLVEGASGKNRLCNNYDVVQQSCRVWAHVAHHSTPKRKSKASGETSHTAASPGPAPAATETDKKEKSQ